MSKEKRERLSEALEGFFAASPDQRRTRDASRFRGATAAAS